MQKTKQKRSFLVHPFCMPADRPAPPFVLTSTPMCSQHARACCACSGKAVRVHFVGVAAKRRQKKKNAIFFPRFRPSFTATDSCSLLIPGDHVSGSAQGGAIARARARAVVHEQAGGRRRRTQQKSYKKKKKKATLRLQGGWSAGAQVTTRRRNAPSMQAPPCPHTRVELNTRGRWRLRAWRGRPRYRYAPRRRANEK